MEVSSHGIQAESKIIDGGRMLHLIKRVWSYVKGIAEYSTVYLVFDRYKEYSIKSDTRYAKTNWTDKKERSYTLTLNGPLPPKEVCLASNETKKCLIELISEEVIAAAANAKVLTYLSHLNLIHQLN